MFHSKNIEISYNDVRDSADNCMSVSRGDSAVRVIYNTFTNCKSAGLFVGGIDPAQGAAATHRLLALEAPPTAVFAVSDTLAIGAIKAAQLAGLRVPGDLAVVGFDDIPLASLFEPTLTTVAQPCRALGEQAMALLLQRMDGQQPDSVTLPHALVLRRSA